MNIPLGIYQHFKGADRLYEVITTAQHTETEEELVIYRPLYEKVPIIRARPVSMFLDEVDRPEYNYKGPRFIYVRDKF